MPPGAAPKSLGVLNADPVVRLAAAGTDMRQVPTLAITLEPQGRRAAGQRGLQGRCCSRAPLIETPK